MYYAKPMQDTPWEEETKINHMFMDNLKLYGKSENETKGLVSVVEDFSQDFIWYLKVWCDYFE